MEIIFKTITKRVPYIKSSGEAPEPTENVEITCSFDNEIAGNASGSITVTVSGESASGEYDIMWGDASGIMSNYSPINHDKLVVGEDATYDDLISVNAIPKYATRILAVKNGEIKASYSIPSSKLWSAGDYGDHLYSVELLSDVHYQYETGSEDWEAAFTFGRDRENVEAICISGDLTDYGYTAKLDEWKTARDLVRGTTPVYACNGNHEVYNTGCLMISTPNAIRPYLDSDTNTSDTPYFYKEINDDIYVFVACFDNGEVQDKEHVMFSSAQLEWLENLLETYRNQRVFLFQHIFPYQTNQVQVDYFGNANNVYTLNLWQKSGSTMPDRVKFLQLMEHYKNVIWFSGHSHLKWYLQEVNHSENYYRYKNGARFIHIPSLTIPRDIIDGSITDYLYADSEGALMDVYENAVIIRGRNFVDEKYLGCNSYLLDTTPEIIPPQPGPTPTPETIDITFNNGVKINSSNGSESTDSNYWASQYIPIEEGAEYTISLDASKVSSATNPNGKICWYSGTSATNFISCESSEIVKGSTKLSGTLSEFPTGATHFRIRGYGASSYNAYWNPIQKS